MKITKTTEGDTTTYFYDGVKKYEHSESYNGDETWREFKDGKQIYYKNSAGNENWSDDNPENPKNFIKEEDIRPFEFN